MRKLGFWLVAAVCLTAPLQGAEPAQKGAEETWDAAYLDGVKAGHVQTTVREIERNGEKLRRTTMKLALTVKRFRDTAQIGLESATDETPEGKVVAVSMRQMQARQQVLVLTGVVEGNQLHVTVKGAMRLDKRVPWNDKVVGLYREQQLFRHHKVRAGDEFDYLHFEPLISAVVTIHVAVKDFEEVEILGRKRRLLRAESIPAKIEGVQLPASSIWLETDFSVAQQQVEMPGFGKLTLVRTSKEQALKKGSAVAQMPDIGPKNLIRLNRPIPQPHDTASAVFRVTLPTDSDPGTAFAQDDRQTVKNLKGKSFELHVRAIRGPRPNGKPVKVGPEFLQSNYYINSADDLVKSYAQKAVGNSQDPWKKAQLIERWVHTKMRNVNFSEAMATADHVIRTLEGDCTEHAVLVAAMCRAVDVPSRTALGLVYAVVDQKPVFAYHMWTEVYVRGQWIALDGTLGRGSIGAAHLKIADQSWKDQHSVKPLLTVTRILQGKPAIEVIRTGEGE